MPFQVHNKSQTVLVIQQHLGIDWLCKNYLGQCIWFESILKNDTGTTFLW